MFNILINNKIMIEKDDKKYEFKKFINYIERKQTKEINDIAESIIKGNYKIVLISGPSSSGKTTFAKRLKGLIDSKGYDAFRISLDDFFVDREETPKTQDGRYDFESIYAIDIEFFQNVIKNLISLQPTVYPKYNFKTGKREFLDKKIKLNNDSILIIEGIHAFNPLVLEKINYPKYLIYIEPISEVKANNVVFNSKDIRLIRRIVRDAKFRGYSISDTINMWDLIELGEEKNIYPYKDKANYLFNSSLIYEIVVLKNYIQKELKNVNMINNKNKFDVFLDKILRIPNVNLKYINIIIPQYSILREFIG